MDGRVSQKFRNLCEVHLVFADQLLRTKQKIFFLFHLFCIRVIQRGCDTAAGLSDQHSHEISLRIRKFQQLFLKEFHTWRIAFKRNYHNIRSGISYGNKVMKFIWSVKDELPTCQMVDIVWSVSSVGFFVWSQLFSTVTADTQTITPYVYMYMQIFGGGNTVTERNAGLGAAIGVLLSVCVVIVFTICNRVIKDDDLEF